MDAQQAQRKLQSILGFSEDELSANAEGRILASQSATLSDGLPDVQRFAMIGGMLFVIGIVVAGILFGNFLTGAAVVAAIGLPLGGAIAFVINGFQADIKKDLDQLATESISGSITKQTHGSSQQTFELMIKGMTFTVPQATINAFEEGEAYTIYYAKNTKKILSASPVEY